MTAAENFPTLVSQAQEAESAGFDALLFDDHLYGIPFSESSAEDWMFECYTLMSALAQHTRLVRLSALVSPSSFRNPALLAKEVTTLDHVSAGRAQLGVGAGWYELEHESLGFEFGTYSDRFERLEESLQVITGMLAGSSPTVEGRWYHVADAINSPAPLSKIPVMIGGGGEKKTLRLVALYADESNLMCDAGEVPRKLDVLAQHCEAVGRDRSEISVSLRVVACAAPSHDEAVAEFNAFFSSLGLDVNSPEVQWMRSVFPIGDPDEVGQILSDRFIDGINGFTVTVTNSRIEGRIALLGEVLGKVVCS
jgi:F420-dependent oxidoreductase-like protein